MRKALTLLLSFLLVMSLVSCSGKSNPANKETVVNNEDITKKAQEERAAALEKKAQEGYKLFMDGKYSEAIAIENEVIDEEPTYFKPYYIKGITECYSGNYEEGSKNIDKALSLSPNDYMARFNKALSLELYNQYDQSLIWYNKALEIQKEEWSYYGIASIYGRKGDTINTVKYLKLALELNPDIKNEARNEADFNPVKNSKAFKELIN